MLHWPNEQLAHSPTFRHIRIHAYAWTPPKAKRHVTKKVMDWWRYWKLASFHFNKMQSPEDRGNSDTCSIVANEPIGGGGGKDSQSHCSMLAPHSWTTLPHPQLPELLHFWNEMEAGQAGRAVDLCSGFFLLSFAEALTPPTTSIAGAIPCHINVPPLMTAINHAEEPGPT